MTPAPRWRLCVVAAVAVLFATIGAGQEPKSENQRRANRLAKETSPYLLLHAHNPVDWYPWGAEALDRAKTEKKPIFLSIGYSSCYWCHVMERESFMDDEIADFMNKNFVCIKVDREERPDVDEIYMAALHALGRPGGWPLTMFLTPDAKPFFGGTYFPPRDKEIAPAAGAGPAQRVTGLLTLLTLVVLPTVYA
ncbi:MAG: thioredoxin domain-containing protein, partial [Planctomycetia bacterium 21-64-5]